jgi:predicted HTH transcriptional regulator
MKMDRKITGQEYEILYRDAMIALAIKEGRMKRDENGNAVPTWRDIYKKTYSEPRQSEPGSRIWEQILRMLRKQDAPVIRAKIKDHTGANSDTIQRTLDGLVEAGLVEITMTQRGKQEVRKYGIAK